MGKSILILVIFFTFASTTYGNPIKDSPKIIAKNSLIEGIAVAMTNRDPFKQTQKVVTAIFFVKKKSIQRNVPAFWDAAALKFIFTKIITNPLPFLLGISALFLGSRLVRFSRNYYFTFRTNMFKKGNSGIGHTKV